MAEDSNAVHDATLIDVTLPLVPGLVGRLERGIDVADVGCGSGHAINLMAQAFPRVAVHRIRPLRDRARRGAGRGRDAWR